MTYQAGNSCPPFESGETELVQGNNREARQRDPERVALKQRDTEQRDPEQTEIDRDAQHGRAVAGASRGRREQRDEAHNNSVCSLQRSSPIESAIVAPGYRHAERATLSRSSRVPHYAKILQESA